MGKKPIEHVPVGDDLHGANDPARTPLRRVVASVEWSDGSVNEVKGVTCQWTRTCVRVMFRTPVPHADTEDEWMLWLNGAQVRSNDEAPEVGELIPDLAAGIHEVRPARDIDVWEYERRLEIARQARVNPAY